VIMTKKIIAFGIGKKNLGKVKKELKMFGYAGISHENYVKNGKNWYIISYSNYKKKLKKVM